MPYLRLKNIGPIEDFEAELRHGVTLVRGPAGCGKSTILKAIQVVASGKGRPPLRDGAKVGTVEAAGAHLTVSGKTTRNGELELPNLEGRFDLSVLVDPGVQQQAAADARRIKALIALMGVKADAKRFTARPEFADVETIAPPEALETDDLVDQALRIKRAYEERARHLEGQAKTADGHAKGCSEAAEGLDMEAECDAIVLRKSYDAARDRLTTIKEQRRAWEESKAKAEKAKAAIEAMELPDIEKARERLATASGNCDKARSAWESQEQAVINLRRELEKAEALLDTRSAEHQAAAESRRAADLALRSAEEAHENVAEQRAIVDSFAGGDCPVTDAQLTDAEMAVSTADLANERGVKIRDAREKLAKAELHKDDAKRYREQAEKAREAAHATDHVLSEAIQCDRFRIQAVDGVASLLAPDDEHGGAWVDYDRLSDGQRWREAINLAADRVGENGLIPIPQGAWGELEGATRRAIAERAKARKVYVLSAEVTQTPEDSAKGLHAVAYGGAA